MSPSKKIKTMAKANSVKLKNENFWTPLQALSDCDSDMEMEANNSKQKQPDKIFIPPIKVLAISSDYLLKLLTAKEIKHFLIKKISMGVKIICENINVYEQIKNQLRENKLQFFTHDLKSDRAFKAVIYGLENKSAENVKTELISLGFKCKEVKAIIKNYNDNYTDTIYVVYFENGTVRLHDLRQNVKSLFQTIIRWDYQRKKKNQPTQCRNCQMFGHGERGCFIKTKCSNCAGKHKTTDCTIADKVRCANCNSSHKSTDPTCPNRAAYMQIKQKFNKISQVHTPAQFKLQLNDEQFPKLKAKRLQLNQRLPTPTTTTQGCRYGNNAAADSVSNDCLFTYEEITQLTLDVISKLKT